jgi:putative nucleotidyltransferase with HDIG domain
MGNDSLNRKRQNMPTILSRDEAWAIVTEYTESESLRRHMLAVETALRAYAPRYNGDVELWGVVGLLHDFDYERYPDVAVEGHPVVGSKILRERGVDEAIIHGILAHAPEITGVEPSNEMEKALLAVDELTGFIIACVLVRPSKSILDLELSSIKKKWKDKAFAAPVNRAEIEHRAAELGVPLDEHIQVVLGAMKADAEKLGLVGSLGDTQ